MQDEKEGGAEWSWLAVLSGIPAGLGRGSRDYLWCLKGKAGG